MRRVRFLISFIFLISVIVFGGYIVKTKMVQDTQPPVIECESEEITVSVEDGEDALLKGITAKDNRDGDITDSVRVSSMSHFVNGKRTVTYVVFDKANNVGILERTVKYSDYTSPKIYLNKPLRISGFNGDMADIYDCYTAEDCLDGDITNQVRTIMDADYYVLDSGSFGITLQVNNSAGDVCSIPAEVEIMMSDDEDEEGKQYPVLSEYIVYTSVDKEIKPSKYLKGLMINNMEYEFEDTLVSKSDIKIKSNVDYSEPGVYTVSYSYKAEGAKKAVTKMYVVVEGKERGDK